MGGSPSYAMIFRNLHPLFSLWQKAQRKKLGKKEHAVGRNFASAEATSARALERRSLFAKSDAKTFKRFALNCSTNQNLKVNYMSESKNKKSSEHSVWGAPILYVLREKQIDEII